MTLDRIHIQYTCGSRHLSVALPVFRISLSLPVPVLERLKHLTGLSVELYRYQYCQLKYLILHTDVFFTKIRKSTGRYLNNIFLYQFYTVLNRHHTTAYFSVVESDSVSQFLEKAPDLGFWHKVFVPVPVLYKVIFFMKKVLWICHNECEKSQQREINKIKDYISTFFYNQMLKQKFLDLEPELVKKNRLYNNWLELLILYQYRYDTENAMH